MPYRPPPPVQAFDFGGLEIARFRFEKIAALRVMGEMRSEWVLYHPLRRGLRLAAEGVSHRMTPACLYLVAPRTRYDFWMESPRVRPDNPDFFVRMALVAKGENLAALGAAGYCVMLFAHFSIPFDDEAVRPGVYPVAIDTGLRQAVSRAVSILRASPDQTRFRPAESAGLAAVLAAAVGRVPDAAWVRLTADPRIRRALRRIREEPGGALDTPALARVAGLSPSRFAELFRGATGMTPHEAVRAERVAHAQRLLSHTFLEIALIAERCGFADRYHFSRVFKQVAGFAPAEYRKRSQAGVARV